MTVGQLIESLKSVPADAHLICSTGTYGDQYRGSTPEPVTQMHAWSSDWFSPCEKLADPVRFCLGCQNAVPLTNVVSV